MQCWQRFKTFQQLGKWVELLFLEMTALRCFYISWPWGECSPYDVGVECVPYVMRELVKSTVRSCRSVRCRAQPVSHISLWRRVEFTSAQRLSRCGQWAIARTPRPIA
jgi:hypothetical protein